MEGKYRITNIKDVFRRSNEDNDPSGPGAYSCALCVDPSRSFMCCRACPIVLAGFSDCLDPQGAYKLSIYSSNNKGEFDPRPMIQQLEQVVVWERQQKEKSDE